MAAPALAARALTHRFGDRTALDSVTLTVGPGERVALLGVNGSGKTTFLNIAATTLRPDGGTMTVAGHDVVTSPDGVRRELGVVFQHPALDAALTCREALALQAALVGIPRPKRAARSADALAEAGLADRADDRIGTLSGGLARRLDLARGLLHRPAVALLDEPTTGLDPLARDAFWAFLDRRRADGAQVIATHLMDEAARCDRVVILDAGRVVADGAPHAMTAALGTDALWLDTDDALALAATLAGDGLDATPVANRVLVRGTDAQGLIGRLYERPEVRAASLRPPTLGDVFAHAVGEAPPTP